MSCFRPRSSPRQPPEQLSLPLGYSGLDRASRPRSRGRSRRQRLLPSQAPLATGSTTRGLPGIAQGSFDPDSSLNYFRQRQRILLTSVDSSLTNEVNGNRWPHVTALPPQRSSPDPKPGQGRAHVGRRGPRSLPADPLGRNQRRAGLPRCGSLDSYSYKTRKLYRCKACSHQFSVTSGTIFASRKLPDPRLPRWPSRSS